MNRIVKKFSKLTLVLLTGLATPAQRLSMVRLGGGETQHDYLVVGRLGTIMVRMPFDVRWLPVHGQRMVPRGSLIYVGHRSAAKIVNFTFDSTQRREINLSEETALRVGEDIIRKISIRHEEIDVSELDGGDAAVTAIDSSLENASRSFIGDSWNKMVYQFKGNKFGGGPGQAGDSAGIDKQGIKANVGQDAGIKLIAPRDNTTLNAVNFPLTLNLNWLPDLDKSGIYQIELWHGSENPRVVATTTSSWYILTLNKPGKFFLRISKKGASKSSEIRTIDIQKSSETAEVSASKKMETDLVRKLRRPKDLKMKVSRSEFRLLTPDHSATILFAGAQNSVVFSWEFRAKGERSPFELVVSDATSGEEIIRKSTVEPLTTLTLKAGDYLWHIESTGTPAIRNKAATLYLSPNRRMSLWSRLDSKESILKRALDQWTGVTPAMSRQTVSLEAL